VRLLEKNCVCGSGAGLKGHPNTKRSNTMKVNMQASFTFTLHITEHELDTLERVLRRSWESPAPEDTYDTFGKNVKEDVQELLLSIQEAYKLVRAKRAGLSVEEISRSFF
jgi:hypothetical protein